MFSPSLFLALNTEIITLCIVWIHCFLSYLAYITLALWVSSPPSMSGFFAGTSRRLAWTTVLRTFLVLFSLAALFKMTEIAAFSTFMITWAKAFLCIVAHLIRGNVIDLKFWYENKSFLIVELAHNFHKFVKSQSFHHATVWPLGFYLLWKKLHDL